MITLLFLAAWGFLISWSAILAGESYRRSKFKHITKTERSLVGTSLAVAGQDEAPKGLGRRANKPLMRRLNGNDAAPDRYIASDTLLSAALLRRDSDSRSRTLFAAPALNLSAWRNKDAEAITRGAKNGLAYKCETPDAALAHKLGLMARTCFTGLLSQPMQSEILCRAHLLSISLTIRRVA